MLFVRNIEFSGATILLLQFFDCWSLFLDSLNYCIGDTNVADFIISLLRLSDMEFTHNGLSFFRILGLLGKSMVKENVTSASSDISDTITTLITHLDEVSIGFLGQRLDLFLSVGLKFSIFTEINFGQYYDKRFSLE